MRSWDTVADEIVRHAGMAAAEVAELPAQGRGRLGLLPEHRLGFEEPRLELRIAADEVVDRLAQEGEIVLEAADLLQPVDQVGEADADQLVLLADGIEGAVGPDQDRLALLRSGAAAGMAEACSALRLTQGRLGAASSCFLPKRFLKDVQPEDMMPAPYA